MVSKVIPNILYSNFRLLKKFILFLLQARVVATGELAAVKIVKIEPGTVELNYNFLTLFTNYLKR